MIKSLTIKKRDKKSFTDYEYVHEIELFKRQPTIEFKPGINVVFGPNGGGKSTVLSLLALHLAAKQGGYSRVTTTLCDAVLETWGGSDMALPGDVEHDGQSTLYFGAEEKEGLRRGHFDDDFFIHIKACHFHIKPQ